MRMWLGLFQSTYTHKHSLQKHGFNANKMTAHTCEAFHEEAYIHRLSTDATISIQSNTYTLYIHARTPCHMKLNAQHKTWSDCTCSSSRRILNQANKNEVEYGAYIHSRATCDRIKKNVSASGNKTVKNNNTLPTSLSQLRSIFSFSF